MLTEKPANRKRLGGVPYSAAQTRILDAALDLIADHGVSGTSLQMIADAVGVTKAAVYHQFKTKEEIVIAVTDRELGTLEEALAAAEAQPEPLAARKALLTDVIEMAVRRRRWVRTLQSDPVIVRLLGEHEPFRQFISRLYGILLGTPDDTEARIAAALLSGAIGGTVVNPLVDDVDDATLCAVLIPLIERMMQLPVKAAPAVDVVGN
ncbi:TetR/AcrR family transcriptional regulator [Mycobacterium talmoniae]|uniref:HTH-type transcriptional regulator AcrR n=1 Tax=Mycobacterium talmoniae TaxID=1858794 RepID=A0A1S1N2Y6_9MYCO|nr:MULTISPECIES: TetR/AcrR family transcriptional regulator [Mycobacterium]OHU93753.1 TetR family transcriptional regulator [Mycobacterium talmoniae]PQM44432.1 HTH-type transcriptional regulator AcrR [Mycobacterium talmoniae]